jgi:hypothetical protein
MTLVTGFHGARIVENQEYYFLAHLYQNLNFQVPILSSFYTNNFKVGFIGSSFKASSCYETKNTLFSSNLNLGQDSFKSNFKLYYNLYLYYTLITNPAEI